MDGLVMKVCHKCHKQVFYSDKYDWKKTIPICFECARKDFDEETSVVVLRNETIKETMKRLGIKEEDVKFVHEQMVKLLKRRERDGFAM